MSANNDKGREWGGCRGEQKEKRKEKGRGREGKGKKEKGRKNSIEAGI